METATKVASFVITNLPWENSDNVKSDMQVLCELAGKIMSDIKDTELGNEEYIKQKVTYFPQASSSPRISMFLLETSMSLRMT